ncbi:MAG: GAF domain-containing sensor histidine kinase [Gammaproteobacteria bacterium]|nr:GAF domain-containing sensor histidine kinase [Gammaproteobacteria bacterium]
MISALPEKNEKERIRALNDLDILDTLEEAAYDDLTYLAAKLCDAPIALVSLVDESRQWFKSHHGLDTRETSRDVAFCAHAIAGDDVFIVEDADNDERFNDNPFVTDAPHVKFYAGMPLYVGGKYAVGTLCVIDDHARKLSDEQRKSLEVLARQVVTQLELRLKIKQLNALDHTKDEFISMVSHELRTPLTSIVGSLGLLTNAMQDQLGPEAALMAGVAHRNADRLINIVNDILDIAKIDAGKLELSFTKVSLNDAILDTVESNVPYATKCKCELKSELSETEGLELVIDKGRIIQVMNNLMSNAAKFTNDNDTIIIKTSIDDDFVNISVIDHGPGIAESRRGEMFKRFVQSPSNINHKLPGTGLGLNLCKYIVEQHNGVIDFRTEDDVGTEFYFKLPLKT